MVLLALALSVAIPEGAALTDAIRARDAEFFQVFFDSCEPDTVRAMVTDDFEMYHDRGGVVATNADAFVADYRTSCTARQHPDAWRSRRELVAETLQVYPVPGFGAIEQGDHLFYERRGDGPERMAGRAHFVQLWQLTDDGWKLARVFSYAHVAVP
ncbi:MAG: nuclear transport factor 2 family protein [Sphingopyxis sp.]